MMMLTYRNLLAFVDNRTVAEVELWNLIAYKKSLIESSLMKINEMQPTNNLTLPKAYGFASML